MKRLIVALAALLLAACSAFTGASNPITAAPAPFFKVTAVATLEPLGSCSHGIAAAVSENAMARERAAVKIRAGKMGVDDGLQVLQVTDQARAFLNRACAPGQAKPPDAESLKAARALTAKANQITERAR